MAFVLVRLGIGILLDSPDVEGTQVVGSNRGSLFCILISPDYGRSTRYGYNASTGFLEVQIHDSGGCWMVSLALCPDPAKDGIRGARRAFETITARRRRA
jgi:hypothetical protein